MTDTYLCQNCEHAFWDDYMYDDVNGQITFNPKKRIECKWYGFPQPLHKKKCQGFEQAYDHDEEAPWGGI